VAKEIETKFKVDNAVALRKKLGQAKASVISKTLERDVYYTLQGLRFPGTVIRLRTLDRETGIFTVKLPGRKSGDGPFKIRDEYEARIRGPVTFGRVMRKVGFTPCFIKEKVRETYTLKNAKILLDKLPYLGWYMEIEARKSRIKEIAEELGFSMAEAIPGTYMDLFDAYKKNVKKKNLSLTFPK